MKKPLTLSIVIISIILATALIMVLLPHMNTLDFSKEGSVNTDTTAIPKDVIADDVITVEKQIYDIKNSHADSEVIVSIGNRKITRKDYEIKKLQDSLLAVKRSEKESLMDLLITKVLDIEADKRNISVADEEIRAYIENVKNSMNDDFFNSEYIKQYISSKGITREEFINEEIAKYTKQLLVC